VENENKPIVIAVDDEQMILNILSSFCNDYDLKPVLSAETMLRVLNDGLMPDLILLDIRLRGIDGFEAAETLKKDDRYKDIPIIFISGDNDDDMRLKAFEVGAFDFVSKPIRKSILVDIMERALNEKT